MILKTQYDDQVQMMFDTRTGKLYLVSEMGNLKSFLMIGENDKWPDKQLYLYFILSKIIYFIQKSPLCSKSKNFGHKLRHFAKYFTK